MNNSCKLKELKSKYQSENTIYEKSMNSGGRNFTTSMLGGFLLQNKTHGQTINSKLIERSTSECSNISEKI